MTIADAVVVVFGIAAVAWVNWYFRPFAKH